MKLHHVSVRWSSIILKLCVKSSYVSYGARGMFSFPVHFLSEFVVMVLTLFSYMQLADLPEIDCILITQSLDDHCHLNTLKPFSQKLPNVRVIATPNAKTLLDPLFTNVSITIHSIFSPITKCHYDVDKIHISGRIFRTWTKLWNSNKQQFICQSTGNRWPSSWSSLATPRKWVPITLYSYLYTVSFLKWDNHLW